MPVRLSQSHRGKNASRAAVTCGVRKWAVFQAVYNLESEFGGVFDLHPVFRERELLFARLATASLRWPWLVVTIFDDVG
jgi:hypothetical protein